VWFGLSQKPPLFAFAGVWTRWTGTRGTKSNAMEGEHELYGFLTRDANEMVGRHPS
jgi:putative SOS response-associated peptidase YedK